MNKIKRYLGIGLGLPGLAYNGRAYNSYGFGTRAKTTWDVGLTPGSTVETPVREGTA